MLPSNQIQTIAELQAPILSVCLNTMNRNSSRHPQTPAHLAWFRKQAAAVALTLSIQDRKQFLREADRIEQFLERRRPEERALAIFAGGKAWTVVPLQTNVESELQWGKPALGQLFRLLNGHPPYGVVAVDHHAARFFVYRLGELTSLGEKVFDVDVSGWRKKDLGHFAGERVRKTRGSNREPYELRLEAQYERLCRETAEETVSLWKKCGFEGLFLIGPDQLTHFIRTKLSNPFSAQVFSIAMVIGKFSPRSILRRVEPHVAEFEQRRQLATVKQLLIEEGKFETDLDELLARLQQGGIHTLVVASDLDLKLHECIQCGLAARSADPVCMNCGGELRPASLFELLPSLTATHHTRVEFVSGEAARLLAKVGGIGGWSREHSLMAAG
ncbi:MAG TPA: VLRF1 family aeRF1-type release factor [Candidatus Acidoferrum sp.]|nr:VLRF1 family aeRF1-type release factor [Candidatus Acidoferrum sp.]